MTEREREEESVRERERERKKMCVNANVTNVGWFLLMQGCNWASV